MTPQAYESKYGNRDPVNVELELLREFFSRWDYMHSLRTSVQSPALTRMLMEQAAQKLVETANELRALQHE